ncbi:uncharacterized protein BP01DRAFT_383801 [Aspergillus saccharolyticus JOP 1030-1]|uniref:Uncharacterized protein n=1 Tax=Aspergillus saccharolyticus JOP 1030-1 TaxID=1450539 RepID=A0A318ZAJ5_9EURO|nr:hypothetical protein BP01DRAFT_383801 [Aspergillus saccharolyticus JOP 1030-1]PYH44309.1 hypothetical protein BP01DRAFT_383801 [Aspergillus saccharolyticus JOP 1030-1]
MRTTLNLQFLAVLALALGLFGQPITELNSPSTTNSHLAVSGPNFAAPEPEVDALIVSLLRIGANVIALDKTISTLQLHEDSVSLMQAQMEAINRSIEDMNAQALALDYLDPVQSKRVTSNTVILKPTYTHLLKVIAEQKGAIWVLQFGKPMHDWLGDFRTLLLVGNVVLNAILTIPDGALIEAAWALQDREFPPVQALFHGPYPEL